MLCPSAPLWRSTRACWSLTEPCRCILAASSKDVRVAWRLVGNPAAPVIAALGGISAGRAVVDTANEKGWWSDIIGPGRALDSRGYRILGIDFLGGSGGSTGPRAGQSDFPRSPLKTRPSSCVECSNI